MPIGITRGLTSWRFQDNYVERVMDNAAYSAAHPDDTLVLAGPARAEANINEINESNTLLAIGMLQSLQISQQKSTQPVMAIGSGRSFFVSGKAQGRGSIQRLFVNGRNLLRVLYHNARASGLDVTKFDDQPVVNNANEQFYINLDSELYLIPFGLASLFRSKAHDNIGGFYAELVMIGSYSVSFQAGMNMVAESVDFMFDRLQPYSTTDLLNGPKLAVSTLDAVLGFTNPLELELKNNSLGGDEFPPGPTLTP